MKKKKSLHQEYGSDAPLALSLGMRDQAERIPLPPRFMVKAAAHPSAVVILDTETGRTVEVGLFAYHSVREVLSTLFS